MHIKQNLISRKVKNRALWARLCHRGRAGRPRRRAPRGGGAPRRRRGPGEPRLAARGGSHRHGAGRAHHGVLQRIYALLETDFETLKYKNSELKITDRICILRHHITSAILKSAPKEQAALITGLISGDKSYMSEKVYDSFRKNSLVHILSV